MRKGPSIVFSLAWSRIAVGLSVANTRTPHYHHVNSFVGACGIKNSYIASPVYQ